MSGLCVCGQPVADCPHLGAFASVEAKRAWFLDIAGAMVELDSFVDRVDAKRAFQVAQLAAEKAKQLPVGADVSQVLALIIAALAKAAALMGL